MGNVDFVRTTFANQMDFIVFLKNSPSSSDWFHFYGNIVMVNCIWENMCNVFAHFSSLAKFILIQIMSF
jgi:hypothetical protein